MVLILLKNVTKEIQSPKTFAFTVFKYSETPLSCIMYTSTLYMYQVFNFPI